MSKPRSLQSVLAGHGKLLEQLLSRAEALARLDRCLQRLLPPSLAGHVVVSNLRDGILVLQTPSAEWRTRTHFLAPRLLEALRGEVPGIAEIRIRVIPAPPERPPARTEVTELSACSADILAKAAAAMDDPRLRRSLSRLAARYRRP